MVLLHLTKVAAIGSDFCQVQKHHKSKACRLSHLMALHHFWPQICAISLVMKSEWNYNVPYC
jgi:hypothetical protein